MPPADIARCRLASQQIARSPSSDRSDPHAVVAHLGAVQAQDYASAKWAIGLRCCCPSGTTTDADIERAIADRTIVRTWPMRGTLHFVAAEDARWMLELLTPRVVAASAARARQLELDDATFARSRALFTGALTGGRQQTRAEMLQTLEQGGVSTAHQRGYHLLWRAAQAGLICFASPSGKQPTFALLDEWIPPGGPREKRPTREEALAALALRYFTGHGPATLQDLCWWAGLTAGDARVGLAAVESSLTRVEGDGGKTCYRSPGLPGNSSQTEPRVDLLPAFDEYLLGYRDRSAVLAPEHASRIVPGSNGIFLPTLVVEGRVVGTWKRNTSRRQGTTAVTPALFDAPLDPATERALAGAAQRYAQFLSPAADDDGDTPTRAEDGAL